MAQLSLKTGTSQALSLEPVEDGALLAPTDKKSIYLDQGNLRKEIKTGHTIQNSSEVNIADRDTLQFTGNVSVSDDSINNKTIIDIEADNSITALKETSPATSAHEIGTYLTYNNVIYSVKSAIAVGDTLTVDTNIEVADIPEGAVVYWEDNSAPSGQVQSDWNQTDNTQPDYIKNKPSDDVVTLNGNPLSFTTDSEQAARECVITFEPIQEGSGDPSPSNVRAISGYDKAELTIPRKNIFDINSLEDGGIDSTTGQNQDIAGVKRTKGYIPVKPSTSYILSGANSVIRFFEYDNNKNYLSTIVISNGNTITTSSTTTWIRINAATANFGTEMQVEEGITATAYEPYNPITDYSESTPETVYGGTLNVETGELVVDRVIDTVGSENITWSRYPSGGSHMRYVSQVIAELTPSDQINTKLLSDQLVTVSANDVYFNTKLGTVGIDSGGHLCIVPLSDYSSAQEFVTAYSDTQIVYPLATPYTIHLTPAQVRLLQGNNVVTTNGTSISLTYRNGEIACLADVSSVAESVNSKADKTEVGNLATLTTTDKTSLVGAVNEVNAGLATKADETEVAAIENVYGSKNRLENKATTQTDSGITYTVNSDKSVTLNGTSTAATAIILNSEVHLPAGSWTFGCASQSMDDGVRMRFNDGAWFAVNRTEVTRTYTTPTNVYCQIAIVSGRTVNNVTIYPMIRDARISDATYVPYAMTNRELTEVVDNGLQDYTLLGSWVGDASWAAKQLSDDLSKYKEIMFCIAGVNASDVIINPVRISYKKFKTLNASNKYLGFSAMLSVSALCRYSVYYSSDTMIYLYSDNELSAQYKFALYGIK